MHGLKEIKTLNEAQKLLNQLDRQQAELLDVLRSKGYEVDPTIYPKGYVPGSTLGAQACGPQEGAEEEGPTNQ